VVCGDVVTAVLKPEQRQAKRQKIEENRLKKQQLASVTGSVSAQMTVEEHELTRIITDAFIRHLNIPHSNASQVDCPPVWPCTLTLSSYGYHLGFRKITFNACHMPVFDDVRENGIS